MPQIEFLLMSCPGCGSTAAAMHNYQSIGAWVACPAPAKGNTIGGGCGMSGPVRPKEADAAAAWNGLPRLTETEGGYINES